MHNEVHASEAQLVYADYLFYGCWIGLIIMGITYILYLTGIVAPYVPLSEIPNLWGQSVSSYLAKTNVPDGWGWVKLLTFGDFMNYIGVVLLAGLSIICYLRMLPSLFRKGDKIMYSIAIAEIIVLLVAASGIVGTGGH